MWKITRDLINEAGGKKHAESRTWDEGKAKTQTLFAFRLLDDDGEIYFHGVSTSNESFAPLNNYGMPGYGCTDIQYKNEKGKWESL